MRLYSKLDIYLDTVIDQAEKTNAGGPQMLVDLNQMDRKRVHHQGDPVLPSQDGDLECLGEPYGLHRKTKQDPKGPPDEHLLRFQDYTSAFHCVHKVAGR